MRARSSSVRGVGSMGKQQQWQSDGDGWNTKGGKHGSKGGAGGTFLQKALVAASTREVHH